MRTRYSPATGGIEYYYDTAPQYGSERKVRKVGDVTTIKNETVQKRGQTQKEAERAVDNQVNYGLWATSNPQPAQPAPSSAPAPAPAPETPLLPAGLPQNAELWEIVYGQQAASPAAQAPAPAPDTGGIAPLVPQTPPAPPLPPERFDATFDTMNNDLAGMQNPGAVFDFANDPNAARDFAQTQADPDGATWRGGIRMQTQADIDEAQIEYANRMAEAYRRQREGGGIGTEVMGPRPASDFANEDTGGIDAYWNAYSQRVRDRNQRYNDIMAQRMAAVGTQPANPALAEGIRATNLQYDLQRRQLADARNAARRNEALQRQQIDNEREAAMAASRRENRKLRLAETELAAKTEAERAQLAMQQAQQDASLAATAAQMQMQVTDLAARLAQQERELANADRIGRAEMERDQFKRLAILGPNQRGYANAFDNGRTVKGYGPLGQWWTTDENGNMTLLPKKEQDALDARNNALDKAISGLNNQFAGNGPGLVSFLDAVTQGSAYFAQLKDGTVVILQRTPDEAFTRNMERIFGDGALDGATPLKADSQLYGDLQNALSNR